MSESASARGDAPADDALAELDAMIAEQQGHVVGRRQLSETEVLPAVRAQKAQGGRPAVRARPADPEHGARHRSILEIEERRLSALQQIRNRLAAARADREDAEGSVKP